METRNYETQRLSFKERASKPLPFSDFTQRFYAKSEIYSVSNPDWNRPGRSGDCGSAFFLKKTSRRVSPVTVKTPYWEGPLWPHVLLEQSSYPVANYHSITGLYAKGATCIARVLPTNPNAQLATMLGEVIADKGIGRLPGSLTRERGASFRNAGSEYLNVEFGWIPFYNDVRSLALAVKNRNRIIAGFVRGSDRRIRRRYVYSNTGNSTVVSGTFNDAKSNTKNMSPGTRSLSQTEKIWYSGAFRYHVPLGDDIRSKLIRYEQMANHLLGTRVTPEVVWNLAPWTWFGDWFGNTGDVLRNISSLGSDGLCMQYGYVMCERTVVANDAATGGTMKGSGGYYESVAKMRLPATPYGFGLTESSFSTKQLAVMAALGLSRFGGVPYDQKVNVEKYPAA